LIKLNNDVTLDLERDGLSRQPVKDVLCEAEAKKNSNLNMQMGHAPIRLLSASRRRGHGVIRGILCASALHAARMTCHF
jgi:hypothetical protein